MARKYVIDGGAYSGKTSVIKELARRGFATVPEAATLVIREQLACGGGLLPWVRREEFDRFLLGRVKLLESKIETDFDFVEKFYSWNSRALEMQRIYDKVFKKTL